MNNGEEVGGESNQTETLHNCKINKIRDYLEREMVTAKGMTDREIRLYLSGCIDSLQYFGAISEIQRENLYVEYCF